MKLVTKKLLILAMSVSTNLPAEGDIQLGKTYDNSNLEYQVTVDGHMTRNGSFHYNRVLGQSFLSFYVNYRYQGIPDGYFYARPLKFDQRNDALFTPINIAQLGSDYHTEEASIYLKRGNRLIQIGQFRPVSDDLSVAQRREKFGSPVLCSQEFADVCRLSLRFEGEGDDLAVALKVEVANGSEVATSIHMNGFYDNTYTW